MSTANAVTLLILLHYTPPESFYIKLFLSHCLEARYIRLFWSHSLYTVTLHSFGVILH